MPNLRIIHDNAAHRVSALTASTTAGALTASNLLTDVKTQVHRSTDTSVTYTATWTNLESLGGLALPATNLTSAATIRVRLYSDSAGTTLIADSGTISACPSAHLGLHGWSGVINANAFPYGGASKVAVWFNSHWNARRCVVDLVDTSNPAGYIDCARLVVGPYWEAPINPKYGASAGVVDTTEASRSEAGDQLVVRGAVYERMALELADLKETHRPQLAKILRSSGAFRNMFFSLLPGAGAALEQDHMIYGRRPSSPFRMDFYDSYSTSMEIEGW